ncbi:hypothetical protein AUJ14_04505 [Candidatus Micrarchaeota archaeon CG1_02_55_22]|nr:MAG: hypothetical protein AUJ14_04505 [Candidatus Micrarchaeota archaeon CG1_02_55_22]
MTTGSLAIDEFVRLLNNKKRPIAFTAHALERARQRLLPQQVLEQDLSAGRPVAAFEQESDSPSERKFSAYYLQRPGLFHRYVVTLNNVLRVITVMRTSKELQRIVAGDK